MAKSKCKSCNTTISTNMLRSGEAIKVHGDLLCSQCRNTSKRSKASTSSKSARKKSSKSAKKVSGRKKKKKTKKSFSRSAKKQTNEKEETPDVSFGENLARTSGTYRPRATSSYRAVDNQKQRSKRYHSHVRPPSSPLSWSYIIAGLGLLALACLAILFFPSNSSTIKTSSPTDTSTPGDTIPEDKDDETNGEIKTPRPAPPPQPRKTVPDPDENEAAVVLMSDLDVSAEERSDRRSWRLQRGQPIPGQREIVLGSFENPIEILNWTYEPRGEIFAWLGLKGVTDGNHALRLKVGPKTPGNSEVYFNLKLHKDDHWDWTGAQSITCDLFNPTQDAITVRIAFNYLDGEKKTKAEWPFVIEAKSKRSINCPLQKAQLLNLKNISSAGIIISRASKKALVLYMDKLTVSGSFD